MTRSLALTLLISLSYSILISQSKRMDESVYDSWNTIEEVQISNNGDWVSYVIKPGKGNSTLYLYNTRTEKEIFFDRSGNAQFDPDNEFIAFKIHPDVDSIHTLKLNKTKKDDLPGDSLAILNLLNESFDKIPSVKSYKLPKENGGVIAYQLSKRSIKEDSTLVKEEGKENGTQLFVRDMRNQKVYNYDFVKNYKWSEKNNRLLIHSSGSDSIRNDLIFLLDCESGNENEIQHEKGEYAGFSIDQDGNRVAFIADRDTTEAHARPLELFYWSESDNETKVLVNRD
ncbi:MAG: hypothetical protein HKO89_06060, partial [Saprospiraceae bacterium]|nr:hypothetical protein [Saprospiraceae bacterium]